MSRGSLLEASVRFGRLTCIRSGILFGFRQVGTRRGGSLNAASLSLPIAACKLGLSSSPKDLQTRLESQGRWPRLSQPKPWVSCRWWWNGFLRTCPLFPRSIRSRVPFVAVGLMCSDAVRPYTWLPAFKSNRPSFEPDHCRNGPRHF